MTQSRSNVLVTLLCSKKTGPHAIATVRPGRDGAHVVKFKAMMRDATLRPTAVEMTAPLADFESRLLYCPSCRHEHVLTDTQIEDAIARRIPRVALQTVGFDRDPLGVLIRQHGDSAC